MMNDTLESFIAGTGTINHENGKEFAWPQKKQRKKKSTTLL